MSASNPLEQPLEPYPFQPEELEAIKKDFEFVKRMVHELLGGNQFVLDRGWSWTLESEGNQREYIGNTLDRSKPLQRLLPYLWQGVHDDNYLIGDRADLEYELLTAHALMNNRYRFEHTYGEDWGKSRFILELRSGIAIMSDRTEATSLNGEPFSHETSHVRLDELLEKYSKDLLEKLQYKQYQIVAGFMRFLNEAAFISPISFQPAISYRLACSEQKLYWNSSRSGKSSAKLSEEECYKLVNILLHHDIKSICDLDPHFVDVFCVECADVYCESEWQAASRAESLRICPKGHVQTK